MAKIFPFYSLCPLIEQQSFLGLTKDADSDTVVVTANSNIIGRYRISDPKQISSWNSKGSLTCAVVYDKSEERYVGAFNHNEIRFWSISDESIDRVKKYKFAEQIQGLLVSPTNGKTIIVFCKGNTAYLEDILDLRKNTFETAVLGENESIHSYDVVTVSNTVIVTLLLKAEKSRKIMGVSPNKGEDSVLIAKSFKSTQNVKLLDHCLVADKCLYCVSLWSDGKLCRECLYPNAGSSNLTTLRDMNIRKLLMKTLSSDCVAICGLKKEDMLLIIYNVKYNLILCKQVYENCCNPPQLWNLHSKLFLIIGHNLVVVPYAQENRKLSTLVGSHIEEADQRKSEILSETEICQNRIPELIENNDIDAILRIISSSSDLPDSTIIDILQWSLRKKKAKRQVLAVLLETFCISDSSGLRNIINTDTSLELLEYVISRIPLLLNNCKLISWASLIIDSFYQQYVTSNDKVVLEKLDYFLSTLQKECDHLNQYKEIAATASCIKRQKIILKK